MVQTKYDAVKYKTPQEHTFLQRLDTGSGIKNVIK